MTTPISHPTDSEDTDEIIDAELVEPEKQAQPGKPEKDERALILARPEAAGTTQRKTDTLALQNRDVIGEAVRRVRESRERRLQNPGTFEEHIAKKLSEANAKLMTQKIGKERAKEYEIAAAIMNSIFLETSPEKPIMNVKKANHWKEFREDPGTLGEFLQRYGTALFTEIAENFVEEQKREGPHYGMEHIEYRMKKETEKIDLMTVTRSGHDHSITVSGDVAMLTGFSFAKSEDDGGEKWRKWEKMRRAGLEILMEMSGIKRYFLRKVFDLNDSDGGKTFNIGDFENIDIRLAIRLILYELREKAIKAGLETATQKTGSNEAEITRIFGEYKEGKVRIGKIEQQLGWFLTRNMFPSVGNDEIEVNGQNVETIIEKMLMDTTEAGEKKVKRFEMPHLQKMDKVKGALSRHLLRQHFGKKALTEVAKVIDPEIRVKAWKLTPGKLTEAFTKEERDKRARRKEIKKETSDDQIKALYDGLEYAYKLHAAGRACVAKYDGNEREHGQILLALSQIYLEHLEQVARSMDMQREIDASGIAEMPESIYRLAGVPNPQELQKDLMQKAGEIGHALRAIQRVREEDKEQDEE